MTYQPIKLEGRIDSHTGFLVEDDEPTHPDSSKPPYTSSPMNSARDLKLSTTWRELWRTPSTMAALFLLACVFAMLHLVLFIALDKRRTDGPDTLSQSYVAVLSHLLGVSFRASLSGSLAVAYTQYLWRLLRQRPIKISSIETLFKITRNPFLLLQPKLITIAPMLVILAAYTWLLPLAVAFTPGALIVVSDTAQNTSYATVPTYNGSSLGNNSIADAEIHSLAVRFLSGGSWIYLSATPSVQRLGRLVLELDGVVPFSSPCGQNCTYVTQFSGPYLQCNTTILNQTVVNQGTWACGYNAFTASNISSYDETKNDKIKDVFDMSVSRAIHSKPNISETIVQEVERITCTPSWASYIVNVTYNNGLQTIERSEKLMGSLRDMMVPLQQYYPSAGIWPEPLRQTLTAFNHYALIDALISPLSGNYTMLQSGQYMGGGSSAQFCGATGGTLAADTHLNTQRNNFSRPHADGPKFVVTQAVLNDALFNLTMSAAFQLGFWETTLPVTITSVQQLYSFAYPRTLLIPYLTCLLISVPFLLLGLISLRSNGVSAIEGGFLQILMTTTGSKTLEKAAAGGCLGGEENTPEDLKSLKVRFGELISSGIYEHDDSGQVRRAGFGTDEEVVPLRRSHTYGI
ncbi:hypothetical protein P153DRAFT_397338 [Dothidotthia symphoricarpi CBS 119687]|uniref:Uncharacterized protein n=1 Tax=Dothidotthia symphoricarpi CBS 119687 TaxID=1392245 RepID=A0A6A6AE39_9PLEO|nr:uncharacterized protein P153DRAFT_397338 [Dothidotthia symphoricarpi CBS 119687]KAF2129167.1 hypothetical protein P153DRAFT_397338 [Dothidotthia symphoricarpi CBS 119687]